MTQVAFVGCALSLLVGVAAQAPVLAPTSSTTIDVDPTFGQLSYSAITIPSNVAVRFTGNYPVRLLVSGDVRVDGTLDVGAVGSVSGPGAVTTGAALDGYQSWVPGHYEWITFPNPTWVPGYYSGSFGGNGRHSSIYGSALPFDLAGGSRGGSTYQAPYYGPYETRQGAFYPQGGGGGTLVVEAAGRIVVAGVVAADGAPGSYYSIGNGAGGSILLRGLLGCSVAAGASVRAMPEGIVRLDAYGSTPQVAGTVQPTPLRVRYPDLAETVPPTVGGLWQLRVAAPRGDVVFLAASFQPGSGTNQYGTYGIDLGNAITFAVVTAPANGHDPLVTFDLPVPNLPQLSGLPLWVQGLDWFTSQAPLYTQTVHTSVQ